MIAKLYRPLLAAHPKDKGQGLNAAINSAIEALSKPLLGSIKYDGIRVTIQNSKLYTRTLKLLPNVEMQEKWGFDALNGLDAEITVGPANAADCFNVTQSFCMSRSESADRACLNVIDRFDRKLNFEERRPAVRRAAQRYSHLDINLIDQVVLKDTESVTAYENKVVGMGHEGIMLRDPYGEYTQKGDSNRSTLTDGNLVAIKRFVEAEALITGVFEQNENTNERKMNELGKMRRSSELAGMVGKNTLGGFTVVMLGPRGGRVGPPFNIGTGIGLTNAYRALLWARQRALRGKIVKFKYQMVGTIDAPRLPIFLGFRDRRDM